MQSIGSDICWVVFHQLPCCFSKQAAQQMRRSPAVNAKSLEPAPSEGRDCQWTILGSGPDAAKRSSPGLNVNDGSLCTKSRLPAHMHWPPSGFTLCKCGLPGATCARVTGKQETGCHSFLFLQPQACPLFCLHSFTQTWGFLSFLKTSCRKSHLSLA